MAKKKTVFCKIFELSGCQVLVRKYVETGKGDTYSMKETTWIEEGAEISLSYSFKSYKERTKAFNAYSGTDALKFVKKVKELCNQ